MVRWLLSVLWLPLLRHFHLDPAIRWLRQFPMVQQYHLDHYFRRVLLVQQYPMVRSFRMALAVHYLQ